MKSGKKGVRVFALDTGARCEGKGIWESQNGAIFLYEVVLHPCDHRGKWDTVLFYVVC